VEYYLKNNSEQRRKQKIDNFNKFLKYCRLTRQLIRLKIKDFDIIYLLIFKLLDFNYKFNPISFIIALESNNIKWVAKHRLSIQSHLNLL
jgi:hypothetical protein